MEGALHIYGSTDSSNKQHLRLNNGSITTKIRCWMQLNGDDKAARRKVKQFEATSRIQAR